MLKSHVSHAPRTSFVLQLALELVQAQHAASECQAGADKQKAQLSEAKAAQQAQLVASLDARLQAAHAALDASCAAVAEWRQRGAALLERYACILHGQEALPGAFSYAIWSCVFAHFRAAFMTLQSDALASCI